MHVGRVNRLVLSMNQNFELMVGTGIEPGETTFRFWNMLDKAHPDHKFMKKLQKRKKRNFIFGNCPIFTDDYCSNLSPLWCRIDAHSSAGSISQFTFSQLMLMNGYKGQPHLV